MTVGSNPSFDAAWQGVAATGAMKTMAASAATREKQRLRGAKRDMRQLAAIGRGDNLDALHEEG